MIDQFSGSLLGINGKLPMVTVSVLIISRGVEILHQITLGINQLGKKVDSAWYQPHQGGLEAIFWIILGISFLIMRVVILHGYQPHQGGLEAIFGSFWGSVF